MGLLIEVEELFTSIYFDGRENLYYLCRTVWECFDLDEPRRVAILNAIDTYQPLSQAIVVAFSNLDDQEEVTTCLIKLT